MSKDTKSPDTQPKSTAKNSFSTLFDLASVCKKPLEISFSAEKISTDGGLLLLREIEGRNGILQSIANCIQEDRHTGYVKHSIQSMLTQRVFQIAAGYEDANDCDTLRDDMVLKICSDVLPESGHFCSKELMAWVAGQNVTDIRCVRTKALYEQGYCARGQMELYIKENKSHLLSDRMSCSRFEANQFRLFMHSAAYVLLHALREKMLQGTEYATATMKTIRLRLIKVAAYVKEMKTRIKIGLPKQFPDLAVLSNCLSKFSELRC